MKRIEAIVRPSKVGVVVAALEKVGHPGVMISELDGHGNQKGLEQQVRGKTYKVNLFAKTRVEVVAKDKEAEKIVKAIREAVHTDEIGDGKIFIHPVEDAIRVRTAQRGDVAL